MLYDPKWEQKTDPRSLESIIAWLEKQPAAGAYPYMNCDGGCLFGQYFKALGLPWEENWRSLPEAMCAAVSATLPHTFGAALKRARAFASRS